MSSREMLELLDGLPDSSRFKEAIERTFRVVEHHGDDPELKGKLLLLPGYGPIPSDVQVIAEYVDWTYDRKLTARMVRELVALRGHTDFSNLDEPLQTVLADRQAKADLERLTKGKSQIQSGLYGYEKGGT